MALEAVIYSQDPFQGCNYFKDLFSSFGCLNFDSNTQLLIDPNFPTAQQVTDNPNGSFEYPTSSNSSPVGPPDVVGRKKRRRRSMKNKEEVENQRMTHIAVERNRRKQMNEYLAAIRSLMPPSYVQRGDQASIIGGAINYVKELEQLLQSLEAQKNTSLKHQQSQLKEEHPYPFPYPYQQLLQEPDDVTNNNNDDDESPSRASFSDFFSSPQYSLSRGDHGAVPGAAEIQVNMADSHANVKILSKRRPKQLLKLVAGFQALRLGVLHVNVTTVDGFAMYSLSLKVEEGCHLNSVEEIAAAANHIIGS